MKYDVFSNKFTQAIVIKHIAYQFSKKEIRKFCRIKGTLNIFTWEEFIILCNDLGSATRCDREALVEYKKILFKTELEGILK